MPRTCEVHNVHKRLRQALGVPFFPIFEGLCVFILAADTLRAAFKRWRCDNKLNRRPDVTTHVAAGLLVCCIPSARIVRAKDPRCDPGNCCELQQLLNTDWKEEPASFLLRYAPADNGTLDPTQSLEVGAVGHRHGAAFRAVGLVAEKLWSTQHLD